MIAIRGTVDDYQRWAGELGLPGWGWPEMLDAFLTVEDDADYGGDGLHGKGGRLPLWRVPIEDLPPLDHAVRIALRDLGYPECDDYHAPGAAGVSRCALTIRDGRRWSTNDAYIESVRGQPNFEVRGETLVDRVLLDGRHAVGVRTITGEEIPARAVILSAGALHSPAILLRSGIGISDGLAVGKNLKDHAAINFAIALTPAGQMNSPDDPMLTSMLRYSSGLAEAGPNDIQIIWHCAAGLGKDALVRGTLGGVLLRVFSHGEVRLRSSDPLDEPEVEFRLLSDDRDRRRLRECLQRLTDVVRHPAVASISDDVRVMRPDLSLVPMPSELDDADEALDEWLDATVYDDAHPAGTCRMGTPGDPAAVVDTDCRVIGYDRLRVCDASVMPDLVKANPNLTIVAMAQRLLARISEGQ
jgi:choline dehydrogenase-like flavoprotein